MSLKKTVIVGLFDNPLRADMAKLLLDAQGIPCFLDNRFIVAADWFLSTAVGYIRLVVPEEFAAQATEILKSMPTDAQRGPVDEEDVIQDQPIDCLNCQAPIPMGQTTCTHCGWSYDNLDGEEPGDVEDVGDDDDADENHPDRGNV